MHMTNIKTDTYHLRDTYFVDIVTDDCTYCAYLLNDLYCTKTLMFGVELERNTYEEFLELVEKNAEEYIEGYKLDVENLEEQIYGG